MPNHCDCDLFIRGKKVDIKAFKEFAIDKTTSKDGGSSREDER